MKITGMGQCAWDTLGLFERFPEHDEKAEALRMEEQGGGPVATALVALARWGVDCAFHGVAGDDEAGEKIIRSLESEGVGVDGVRIRNGAHSQRAFIAVEAATARRTIYWQRPTGAALRPDEFPETALDGAAMLMLDGLMMGASLHAARIAKARGVPVMLDAGRMREGMMELAALCDFVVGSEVFGLELGMRKEDPTGSLESARRNIPGVLTITLGSRGSVTISAEATFIASALSVKALDTTGAGDVFHAGYAYGALQGWPLEKCVCLAASAAGLKCRSLGGRAGIPSLEEALARAPEIEKAIMYP